MRSKTSSAPVPAQSGCSLQSFLPHGSGALQKEFPKQKRIFIAIRAGNFVRSVKVGGKKSFIFHVKLIKKPTPCPTSVSIFPQIILTL
ncbi:hypothetical protein [Chryseobacterium taklimakanense]|uniref:hypothetical protein n=1 Tax=Chryseobacterium taklimakanense TaxID=536441 RepID=UPI0023F7E7B3|nr:hypothetical protein [Chryseobacterium taklimakanense]